MAEAKQRQGNAKHSKTHGKDAMKQKNQSPVALRILDFEERFEVNSSGREFLLGDAKKRKKPLPFICNSQDLI